MFEVVWIEVDKSDRIVSKRKSFKTQLERDKFIDKLFDKDNFLNILATR